MPVVDRRTLAMIAGSIRSRCSPIASAHVTGSWDGVSFGGTSSAVLGSIERGDLQTSRRLSKQ